MLGNIFPLDSAKPFTDQEKIGHNRYHPEIPPVDSVKPGDTFRVDSREWFDGAIKNDDSAEDILDVGPIPQEQGPLAGQGWGYTGIFARSNGGSFLVDQFPDAYKAVWDFHGPWASSRHIPEVRFEGLTHPGIMATAPSAEML